jgi:hypothetical protein
LSRHERPARASQRRNVEVRLIDITRFDDDGLAREHWGVFDALALMQELGAIPQTPRG